MTKQLFERIRAAAEPYYNGEDPSHDFSHITRVLNNALKIAETEGGDLEIIVPACYFHDCVNYPKHHAKADFAADESADKAEEELLKIGFPAEKIAAVKTAISEHSFSKGIKPTALESMIVQDADRLEATGAISILRTFASTGQMKRPFYNIADPFCENREADPKNFAVDLFYQRLLVVKDTMNTETARKMAGQRTDFLYNFLDQLKTEIAQTCSLTPKVL